MTNRDSHGCGATTFDLRAGVDEGWTVDMQPRSSLLGPGHGVTLRVTSPASVAAHGFVWANVSDRRTVAHNGSAAGAYRHTRLRVDAPAMAAAPVVESGAPGATFVYDVTVTNLDAAACAPTTFLLLPDLSADWKRVMSPRHSFSRPASRKRFVHDIAAGTRACAAPGPSAQ